MKVSKLLMAIGILTTLSACTTLNAQTFVNDDGAIRGYDAVAYHTEMKPVKGSPAYTYQFNGATWRFASEENLQRFQDNPERYAPQYGGYCAYAMSKGYVVSSDPDAWKIVDGKLYLNYSLGVRKTWLKDVPGYIAKADANWQDKISRPTFE